MRRGIFHDVCLSLLIFVLFLMSLTLILRKRKAEYIFKNASNNVYYLIFTDGLKVYRKEKSKAGCLVDTIYTFSAGVSMDCGEETCCVLDLKRSKIKCVDGLANLSEEVMNQIEATGI